MALWFGIPNRTWMLKLWKIVKRTFKSMTMLCELDFFHSCCCIIIVIFLPDSPQHSTITFAAVAWRYLISKRSTLQSIILSWLTPPWHSMQPPIVSEWQLPACRIWSFLTRPHVCTHTRSHAATDGFVRSQTTDNDFLKKYKMEKVRNLLFRLFLFFF